MRLKFVFMLMLLSQSVRLFSQDRYWIHRPFYENFFSGSPELAEWSLVEDNGTGSFTSSGSGTAILKMDDAAGSYANRIFSVNGGANRYLPLDSILGRLEVNILRTTGGIQRFFVQVQTFTAANTYINQINILPATTGSGFFSLNMRDFTWPANADKVRFIIGGANFSGQQGTVEFDYLSYSNTSGVWNNTANWSLTSGGAGGASVPGSGNTAIFDGAASANGSCQVDIPITVQGVSLRNNFSGNIDLQNAAIQIGSGGILLAAGGVTGNNSNLDVAGDLIITGGAFKSSSGLMSITGNIQLSGANINMSKGTLLFNGSSNQNFSSSSTTYIHRLVINNPTTILLSSDLPVLDSLVLNNGIVSTGANSILLGSSTTNPGLIVGGGSGSINGKITKWISSAGVFSVPFGGTGYSASLALNVLTAPSVPGPIAVSYNDFGNALVAVNFADGSATISNRSRSAWSLASGVVVGGTYELATSLNSLGYTGSLSDFHLVLASGTTGIHGAATGSVTNPTLIRTGLNTAGLFNTFYAGIASNVLPVKWLNFSAQSQINQTTLVRWKLSEYDVDRYEVQRSLDGSVFKSIAHIRSVGAGSNEYVFTDAELFPKSFYRIRSVDTDGKDSYSVVVSVTHLPKNVWSTKRRGVSKEIEVLVPDFNSSTFFLIHSMDGRLLAKHTVTHSSMLQSFSKFGNGVFIITLYHNGIPHPDRIVID